MMCLDKATWQIVLDDAGFSKCAGDSGWAPSTNLSKIKIEVGKTEMLSRYLLFSRSLL